ncbi:MAG: TolA-binding protein [Pseudoalteromonas tetraodonis]|jgi:TolA-binding protein
MAAGIFSKNGLSPWRIVLAASMAALLSACATSSRVDNPSIGSTVRRAVSLDELGLTKYKDPTAGMEEDDRIDYLRVEAIENYRSYIELLPEGVARREAMRRLADLLVDVGPGASSDDAMQRRAEAAALRDNAESPVQRSNDGDYRRRAGATDLYANLLREHPGEDDNDAVRYQLARAYVNEGKPKQAVKVLQELVSTHPGSELVSEANFRTGEILFILRDFSGAEGAYLRVLGSEEAASFHQHARYKLGWTLFKQARYSSALDEFHVLLDKLVPKATYKVSDETIDIALESLDRASKNLVQDTFRVSSLAFTYMEEDTRISQYLASREKRHYEALLYANLADTYASKDRFADAAKTYSQFVSSNQLHPLAPLFTFQAITAWEQGGYLSAMLAAQADYATRFSGQTPFWQTHSLKLGERVIAQVRDYSVKLAQHHHALAQEGTTLGDFNVFRSNASIATGWYNSLFSQYSDDLRAPKLNFSYAELLFDMGNFRTSSNQYSRTAYEYPKHALSADAGYAAVFALDKNLEQIGDQAGRLPSLENTAKLTQARQYLIDSSLKFADAFPSHKDVPAVLVGVTAEMLDLEDYEAAIRTATGLLALQQQPNNDLRYSAWLTIANSQFDSNRWAEAETAYMSTLGLYKMQTVQSTTFRANLIENLAASIYKQGEAQREAGELLPAAGNFLRVLSVTPTASIVTTAHYDAANTLIDAKDYSRAARTLLRFRENYPSDSRQPEIDRKLAQVYLDDSKPGQAANEFNQIGTNFKVESSDTRQQALWRAAGLYDEAGWKAKSSGAYELYVTNFPHPLDKAVDARQRIIELAAERGDLTSQRFWQDELLQADLAGGEARSDRTRRLASTAALALADEADRGFEAVKLRLPLQTNLLAKTERLKSALSAYKIVVNYRYSDQVPKAAFQIAELYARFGKAILNSERPSGLDEIEAEEYGFALEDKAGPLEEKSIAAHEANAARLYEKILDPWVVKSLELLAERVPGSYAKRERSDNYVESLQ